MKVATVVVTGILVVGGWDTYGFVKASSTDTVSSYTDYINGFPILWESVALKKADDAMFDSACNVDTHGAYRDYLQKSHLKLHQEEALEREDDALYRWSKERDSVEALAKYADELPGGRHIAEVDDDLFRAATQEGTISALRVYLQRFEEGKHHETAATEIDRISDEAFDGYHEAAKERGADRRALDTMLAVASFVNRTDRREMQITFEAVDKTGIPAISSHEWTGDETRAVKEIRLALAKMFHKDVVQVARTDSPDADALQLHVKYSLTPTGRRYSSEGSDPFGLGLAQTFQGVRFKWLFQLVVPETTPKEYSFAFSTDPADHFTVTYRSSSFGIDMGPSTSQVYKAMIETAFDDFQMEFMRRFGF